MPVWVQFWVLFLGGLEENWSVHDTTLSNPPCSNNLFAQIFGVVGTGDLTVRYFIVLQAEKAQTTEPCLDATQ